MYSLSVGLVVFPLAYVFFSFGAAPEAVSLHGPIFEVSHVVLVTHGQKPSSVRSIIGEVSVVLRTVGEYSKAFSHFSIEAELPFEERVRGEKNSFSVLDSILLPSKVEVVGLSLEDVVGLLHEFILGEIVLTESVMLGVD